MSELRNRTVNTGYLVAGLVFLGISATWALREAGVIDPDGFRWFVPAVLLAAGAAGLVASLAKGVNRRYEAPAPYPGDSGPVTDLTSDLDRKLAEQEATTQIPTSSPSGSPTSSPSSGPTGSTTGSPTSSTDTGEQS